MAIAFDATAFGGPATGTSLTYAHTVSGANRAISISSFTLNDVTTGITYNSVAATFVNKTSFPGAGRIGVANYYLSAPDTGANNVVISASGSVQIIGNSTSFTGVSQSGQPEATGNNTSTSTSSTVSVTTITDQAWLIISDANAAGTDTAGASTNLRQTDANGSGFGDGGPFSIGSNTLTLTHGSALWATVGCALAPAAGGATTPVPNLTVLGVG